MADFPYTVSNAAELAAAITAANANPNSVNTITLTASITLSADLPILHPDAGSTIVIDGDGFTVDGANAHRIFFVDTGTVVLKDITLSDGYAEGGDGGDGSSGGGGGMGAGGALFVNSTAEVTIINVAFLDNAATGGDGGTGVMATGGGGGGGLGGDGGSAGFFAADHDEFDDTPGLGIFGGGGGGGGFNADGGNGGAAVGNQDGGDGGDGLALGQDDAGSGAMSNGTGGTGGLDGGGGGGGGGGAIAEEGGGGGGGGISADSSTDRSGANGGDFGGGGGGGGAAAGADFDIGDGGFGGGGGGSGVVISVFGGGQGGYGGGGGGESPLGLLGGTGGFGAGSGGSRLEDPDNAGVYAAGGGGGGAGFGGAIFVRDGGKLTIGTTSVSGGTATGGEGGASLTSSVVGQDGEGAGSGLFLQGIGTLEFDPGEGEVATIADSIVDEQGLIASGYTYTSEFTFDAGAWGIWKSGEGTLILSGNNTYAGETHVDAGRLQVDGSIAYSMTTRVSNGATLGGNGRTGDVAVEAGGTVGAGNSAGLLTTGDVWLSSGALFDAEIGGTVAGIGGYDQIAALGAVALGNATLELSLLSGFSPDFGDSFEIIDNNGADAVAGTFSGLAEGAEFVAAGRAFEITYKGGDGNDVVLTAIQAVITGTSGDDLVNATNTIFGELPATDGDDIISGKGGNDKLYGLEGDDEIYGDNGKDKLYGDNGDDYLSGGKNKDKLFGGAGIDTLDGGKGKDKLTGGGDADTFVFATTVKNGVYDRITDFGDGNDVFNLSQDVFKKLGPIGELRAEQFHVGKAKGDEAQVVYQKGKGLLFYDKNGSKSGGDKVFAKVDKGTTLHHDDFFVV
jgi:hypothetical protein